MDTQTLAISILAAIPIAGVIWLSLRLWHSRRDEDYQRIIAARLRQYWIDGGDAVASTNRKQKIGD